MSEARLRLLRSKIERLRKSMIGLPAHRRRAVYQEIADIEAKIIQALAAGESSS